MVAVDTVFGAFLLFSTRSQRPQCGKWCRHTTASAFRASLTCCQHCLVALIAARSPHLMPCLLFTALSCKTPKDECQWCVPCNRANSGTKTVSIYGADADDMLCCAGLYCQCKWQQGTTRQSLNTACGQAFSCKYHGSLAGAPRPLLAVTCKLRAGWAC